MRSQLPIASPGLAVRALHMRLATMAGAVLLVAPALLAQEAGMRERTGPEAEPPAIDFAAEPPSLALPQSPPSTPAPPALGKAFIADVAISDPAGFTAHARRRWTPPESALAGLALSYTKGEPLNAAWVKRQFAENALIGRRVGLDRVVGLVDRKSVV